VSEINRRIEAAVRNLAVEVINKFEKKKKIDNIQELVILATYLNMQKLDELRNDVDGVMRAFQRLDTLIDVVRDLKKAVESLQAGQTGEVAKLLGEVNSKLDKILEKLDAYTVESL
jgi:Mg2+ and Co2+ transporter CorA